MTFSLFFSLLLVYISLFLSFCIGALFFRGYIGVHTYIILLQDLPFSYIHHLQSDAFHFVILVSISYSRNLEALPATSIPTTYLTFLDAFPQSSSLFRNLFFQLGVSLQRHLHIYLPALGKYSWPRKQLFVSMSPLTFIFVTSNLFNKPVSQFNFVQSLGSREVNGTSYHAT